MTAWWGQPIDPLIGRDTDLEHLITVLQRERLVTLTGPGGVGKTRLAQAAVAGFANAADDAVAWFVDCSAIEDAALIGATIAGALGLKGASSADPVELVGPVLRGRRGLLVLDNLEQVPAAGEAVVRLLEGVGGISILATSRITLQAQGEREIQVSPLELPANASREALYASPAGQLFLRRTDADGPDAQVRDTSAAAIVAMLRRLDGMPLGIELAAARSRVLSPEEIMRRLDERGPDAIDSSRRGDRRSLRSMIDWTVGQLTTDEAPVLEALSVCAGFDIALAEALAPDVDVLPAVESLLALGLVQRAAEVNGASRFRLLVVIQESVRRRASPERLVTAQERHAARMLELAATWQRTVQTQEGRGLVAAYIADADNVRRALDHLEAVDPRRALILVARLEDFWGAHGRGQEGFKRLMALEQTVEPCVELATAILALFDVSRYLLSNRQHRDLLARALDLARRSEDADTIEVALQYSAIAASYPGDADSINAFADELEAIARPDDPESHIRLLDVRSLRAWMEHGRSSSQNIALLRELVDALRAAGRERWIRLTADLSYSLLFAHQNAEAVRLSQQASRLLLELGREADASWALTSAAIGLADLGRVDEAVDAAVECAMLASRAAHPEAAANALFAAMPVALGLGQPLLAARLYGAIDEMVAREQTVWGDEDGPLGRGYMTAARRMASEVEIELALEKGRHWDPFAALEELPELLRTPSNRAVRTAFVVRHGNLTRREVEILRLIGLGRSDPEIAEELFISPKTASVHVSNIKGKLGAESRLQVALRAREMGLVADDG